MTDSVIIAAYPGFWFHTEWRDASKASFDEACAEDLEMELSEGAH